MKALVVELSLAKAALTLVLKKFTKSVFYSPLSLLRYYPNYPEPKMPGEDWIKVRTRLSGICGSDIRVITLEESFYLEPLTSFPFIPGHEVVGTVEEVGNAVKEFSEGDRVILIPALSCVVRGFEECEACRKGHYAICYNTDRGKLSPGIFTGICRDTGGGWGEYFVAHETQLMKIPDSIKDENAVFAEPITVGIHSALRSFPKDDEIAAVVGCGIIGLCTIAALRHLGFKGKIVGIDVSDKQAELAKKFGADEVITSNPVEKIAEMTSGRVYVPPRDKPMFVGGGVDVVFECVGIAETVDLALRIAKPLGRVVVAGTVAKMNVDWAPVFAKELSVIGTFGCGIEEVNGEKKSAFDIAVEMLQKQDFSELLTHRFRIEEYKKALWAAINKKDSGAMKVAFDFTL
ncbi:MULTISPECIES: zinc-dependent alcohol dehydrogenase [unclassified Archaeoglobus]|jgi:threonine dehydrogenase-like Zn-dependent dehydrogenase|uniref:zinc-dependent alcohol dehydrogenase n=1 Tax=unclassified Archaeoglobus TaxID=2643606 RepID=UPI0025C15C02|nr:MULTISPECIES: zinc-binding dehydrogenase [unclassified Archaeoglobus]